MPGIPIKILRPDVSVVLIESRERRAHSWPLSFESSAFSSAVSWPAEPRMSAPATETMMRWSCGALVNWLGSSRLPPGLLDLEDW